MTDSKPTVHPAYQVEWSAEDEEYVATCPTYPSLSFLHRDPAAALSGLVDIITEEAQT